ncbi:MULTISPECIES: cobyric acid synthase [Brenneria]|uniref:Cobyric acid synthase n=1 Tax=Brenneria nigrifluens DSM 30175 = ATCC 13028 TaxID=1121120 RepID=A0A2U1UX79_9GAMM|nr:MULTISPECIES: cobyric acid synthase [Brenneria]PWC26267.1 cobyric acid synthase [Brenneria nigrifluens] [Brenneria nigrifluens DSM 30175 = ATCC 13028]QCR06969.1 cobyric acid synthase [Brenneria nigrifluens] [Brenneria nigrifluens DSM 30175 = ATCC 13028]
MTLSVMLQGTASDVGKSVLVAGLCRIFAQDGYRCAPFKSQNMALNSGITPYGEEMGRAQIFQAEAAGIEPDVRMNPVLLKPTSDRKSQVVLMGKAVCNMDAVSYHQYKPQLRQQIYQVYHSLAGEYDVMVLEGAGSPAEINLRDRDIVNMGMAAMADAPVLLVADIDRGGVFAAIYGTLALLRPEEKSRVKGVIINKFRGDVALLRSGLAQIEELTGVPVIGVMPWLDITLEDEDGVALQTGKYHAGTQAAGAVEKALDIAVVRLPHIANFSDFNPLVAQPDVNLRYVAEPSALAGADLLILPGSKNTLGDLQWLQRSGFAQALLSQHQAGVPIVGICGGYQMLGRRIIDGVESDVAQMAGLGLLDVTTEFAVEKVTARVSGRCGDALPGIFSAGAGKALGGYEIHMGASRLGDGARPFARLTLSNGRLVDYSDGAVNEDGSVVGSYIHGLFDNGEFTRALLNALRRRKGVAPFAGEAFDYARHKRQQFDILAAAMREHIDIEAIYGFMAGYGKHNADG